MEDEKSIRKICEDSANELSRAFEEVAKSIAETGKEFNSLMDSIMKQSVAEAYIEENYLMQEESQQIRNILHTISEPYKEVFMWRVFGELSFKEIGALYSKTDNWACVTYHRARKIIQDRLEEINNEKRV